MIEGEDPFNVNAFNMYTRTVQTQFSYRKEDDEKRAKFVRLPVPVVQF